MFVNASSDGKDHINVYSKGKTALGRLLSNFSYSPIKIADGEFSSIEGYWYWLLSSHPEKDQLKKAFGFEAKKMGRAFRAKDWPTELEIEEFKNKIKIAIKAKIMSNKTLLDELKKSTLPLTHYYVYGDKVVSVKDGKWITDYIEEVRSQLKASS